MSDQTQEKVESSVAFIQAMFAKNGSASSMRVLMYIIVGIVLIKNVAFNVSALLHGLPPVAFDLSDLGVIGTAIGGKVTQYFAEKK
jgi:glucose uptake protein GlcU